VALAMSLEESAVLGDYGLFLLVLTRTAYVWRQRTEHWNTWLVASVSASLYTSTAANVLE